MDRDSLGRCPLEARRARPIAYITGGFCGWWCALLCAFATLNLNATDYTFSILAGSPHANVDGVGSAARFDSPRGVAVDQAGNVYIADSANCTIRKITPAGAVSTLAGSPGQSGAQDGLGSAARFSALVGLAIDGSGNLYATSGNAIRKITPAGLVTTVAGDEVEGGSSDGPIATARFTQPLGIAIDAAGSIYVAESFPGRVRKITPEGEVSTFVGNQNGGTSDGRFSQTQAVALDALGNLYVATFVSILKVSPAHDIVELAGRSIGYQDGVGAAASFLDIQSLAVDLSGNVYVADSGNGLIRKVTSAGNVSTLAGTYLVRGYADGVGPAASFITPSGIAVDAAGKLYVSDIAAGTIRTISSMATVATLAGSPGRHLDGAAGDALFQSPHGLARDSAGNVFVADWQNHTIRKISSGGVVTTIAGFPGFAGNTDGPGAQARFNRPYDVAVGSDGTLFVVDAGNSTIRKITPSGIVSTFAGAAGQPGDVDGVGNQAQFRGLEYIAIDAQQNLFVTTGSRTVRRIAPDATVTTLAGSAGVPGYDDGIGEAAHFVTPRGIAVRANGNLIVVDNGAGTIREITPQGLVTTLAGSAGQQETVDGTGSSARFSYPTGVAIDGAGNIYVAQMLPEMRKISTSGVVTTEFTASSAGWSNGLWSDVVVDAAGTILIPDESRKVIRKAAPTVSVDPDPNPTPNPDPTPTPTPTPTPEPPATSRLVNIATRGYCATGDRVMIGGFVVSGTTPKRVLVRAVGPSLTSRGIGVAEALADPVIEVHRGAPVLTSNDNWGDNANAAEIVSTAAAIGASALDAGDTKSAALLLTLEPGVYSFIATGKAGTSGIVLLEVFDADSAATGSTFVNIATRAYSTSGNGVTIGGFVISGTVAKQVLLRAVGPTLTTQGIGQTDVLLDPVIELHRGSPVINSNDNWGDNANAALILSTAARIGATPFAASDTKSAALLVTLQPGVYSFLANGKAGTSGIVLVEVYDAD
jgi:sugar lactone lactonase YvrE